MIIVVVKSGDSVFEIAKKYGVSVDEIVNANMLENPDLLTVGQSLIIPKDSNTHVVLSGESLYGIARLYGVSLDALLALNPDIVNPGLIYPGQIVNVPNDVSNNRVIDVNGYAYPNISENTLKESLPFLTFISPFSYEVLTDGNLRPLNDERIIQEAQKTGVTPIMVITNISESGGFSSDLARTILTNEDVQTNLINNIEKVLKDKSYKGVDVDFEYIFPEDKEEYNIFLQKLADRIKPQGYTLITSIAPKISGSQEGLLYEAHDYAFHGRVADHVIIMTYEWGYTYGPPQAVAPINQVKKVLDYATSVIPSEKILLGMPNYGYDWTLPYKEDTAARSLSNLSALNLALENNAEIFFDETSQAPYFYYVDENNATHVVWFDDVRSFNARLKLIDEYNLGGTSIWTLNYFFRPFWEVLTSQYNIRKNKNATQ